MSVDPAILQKQVEDSLKEEFEGTLSERSVRYIQVKPHEIISNTHFSAPSSECSLLFRDGHFYGCIALVQAVAEALTYFLCEKNGWKPAKKFEVNVGKLATRNIITGRIKSCLLKIWKNRDDYHHLNKGIKSERKELEELAKEKINFINEVEKEIFSFTVTKDGMLCPKHVKYWKNNENNVFLRLEP